MVRTEIEAYSDDEFHNHLENQLKMFSNLQTRAHRLLRISLTILLIVGTFLSVLVSGIVEFAIDIRGPDYYLSQNMAGSVMHIDVLFGLVYMLLLGFLFLFIASFLAFNAIWSLSSILSEGGLRPYIGKHGDSYPVFLPKIDNQSKNKSNILNFNNRKLNELENEVSISTKLFNEFIIIFGLALLAIYPSYRADIQQVELVSILIYLIIFALIVTNYSRIAKNFDLSHPHQSLLESSARLNSVGSLGIGLILFLLSFLSVASFHGIELSIVLLIGLLAFLYANNILPIKEIETN